MSSLGGPSDVSNGAMVVSVLVASTGVVGGICDTGYFVIFLFLLQLFSSFLVLLLLFSYFSSIFALGSLFVIRGRRSFMWVYGGFVGGRRGY